jgi:energy-coupling factor transporter ATP-binding protein EcfA2
MKKRAFYFLTGSSGSGKTTLLKAVKKTFYPNLPIIHSDAFGVPSIDEMREKFDGPEEWQAHNVRQLILLASRSPRANFTVFDVQARPTVMMEEANQARVSTFHITLLECSNAERRQRFVEDRTQPELDNLDMYAWAAYLRGQVDALKLEIIDTTNLRVMESTLALVRSIARFAEENGICLTPVEV